MARIDYFCSQAPEPAGAWVTVAWLPTTAEWHQARAALARGNIDALMGEGEDLPPGADSDGPFAGIALRVRAPEAERASIVLKHCLSGRRWCSRCGSDDLRVLAVPWYWVIWSILFLGIAPFAPARWICRQCGKRVY